MKKIILILILIGFGVLYSCSSQLDINKNPDRLTPADLALNVELPISIAGIAGVQGSEWAIIGGIWAQMFTQSAGSNQYKTIDDYSLSTSDRISTDGWRYAYDALQDIRNVKANALVQENWNYYLIATVLESYSFQMLTDWYGDIPYTEANDPTIFQPNFDDAQAVYDGIITALDDALGRNLASSIGIVPNQDDLVFGGNMSNWTKFANTLKLRIFLRQTEARPAVASAGITAMLNSGVQFLDVDAAMTGFTDAPNISNPFYETDRRQLNTKGNIRASTTMHSYLETNSDERINTFYGAGLSLDQGNFDTSDDPTSFSIINLSPLSDIYFISAAQSYFMQAEALERYSGGTGAKTAYDAGVAAAFNKAPNFYDNTVAEDNQTWVFDAPYDSAPYIAGGGAYEYPTGGSMDDKMKAIITQKWIASFPDNGAEAFFEWQRTGIPNTSTVPQDDLGYVPGEFAVSVAGKLGTGFPQRLLYPNTETSRNANTPTVIPITTPIWWNQ